VAPFDGIIITAAARQVPPALLAQLADNGRLVIPVGDQEQHLWLYEKTAEGMRQTQLEPAKFVPLLPGKQ